jgi:Zn-finger nucleic acid-binding protein
VNCPTDRTVLQIADRHGIEIDYCPSCRGVWLDRGELDKIIERAEGPPLPRNEPRPARHDRYDDDGDRYERVRDGGGRQRKRGGLLGEIFDLG